jgi:hypothetical protein
MILRKKHTKEDKFSFRIERTMKERLQIRAQKESQESGHDVSAGQIVVKALRQYLYKSTELYAKLNELNK